MDCTPNNQRTALEFSTDDVDENRTHGGTFDFVVFFATISLMFLHIHVNFCRDLVGKSVFLTSFDILVSMAYRSSTLFCLSWEQNLGLH